MPSVKSEVWCCRDCGQPLEGLKRNFHSEKHCIDYLKQRTAKLENENSSLYWLLLDAYKSRIEDMNWHDGTGMTPEEITEMAKEEIESLKGTRENG